MRIESNSIIDRDEAVADDEGCVAPASQVGRRILRKKLASLNRGKFDRNVIFYGHETKKLFVHSSGHFSC